MPRVLPGVLLGVLLVALSAVAVSWPAGAGVPWVPLPDLTGPEPLPWTDPGALGDDPPPVQVRGSGWGHSVGMSQYGAHAMARAGHGYREILAHYYPGVTVAASPDDVSVLRVGLFRHVDVDADEVVVTTAGVDGTLSARPVVVTLDGVSVDVPFGERWTIGHDGQFVVSDSEGRQRARGSGPVRVDFDHGGATLLGMPQLGLTYRWGSLEITHADGVLHPVLTIDLDDYVRGIAEMPPTWHPEALKAQSIAARTFAVRQASSVDPACQCHLGATHHDQVYRGWTQESVAPGWVQAAAATTGEIALHDGGLAWTYYSSSHGGRTENVEDSWAYPDPVPYLRSVDDPWSLSADNPLAAWRRDLPNDELAAAIDPELARVRGVRILERTDGGSPARLWVRGVTDHGREVVFEWAGTQTRVAASDLKLSFRSELPSQQIFTLGLTPFGDSDGHPHEWEIHLAHRAGLMNACAEDGSRFCPDDPVDAADVLTVLERAGAATPSSAPSALTTGGPVTVAEAASMIAQSFALAPSEVAWVVAGCDIDGTCPDEPLSRSGLARILVRALDLRP